MTEVLKQVTISNAVAVPNLCQFEDFRQLVISALTTLSPYLGYPQQF